MKRNLILKEGRTGKQVFCKYYIQNSMLIVDLYIRKHSCKSSSYFVPQNGFSIKWDAVKKAPYARLDEIIESSKGENILRFMIHPTLWMGPSFNAPGNCIEDIAQHCLDKINFYWFK
jgi:hypothetical protein